MKFVKYLLIAVTVLGYMVLSHMAFANYASHSIWRHIALLLVMVPLILISVWVGYVGAVRYLPHLFVARCCAMLLAMGLIGGSLLAWSHIVQRLDWIYFIQHLVTNLFLAWLFARTLQAPRTALVTTLARAVHGHLPEKVVRYTRQVTLAWALFFMLMCLVSSILFFGFSLETWSVFANLLSWPLVGLMFVLEYWVRCRANPGFAHASLLEGVRAYENLRKPKQ